MQLEWITDRRRFAAIAGEWDRVAELERLPFLLSSWIDVWYETFAADGELLIAALWRDGSLVAGVPLLAGWRQRRVPVNDHWPACGLLACDESARSALADALVAGSDMLIVPRLAGGEPSLAALTAAASATRCWTVFEPMDTSLVVETGGSFDAYRARLSPKVRSELGRLRRKAAREHELVISPLAVPTDLDAQLRRAFAVEASGWKGRAGTAITSAPETERFYRTMAHRLHDAGKLRISELSLDGEPAAMALSIIHRRRAYTVKFGYDERHRQFGPGLVLLLAMIERSFELELEAYEFAGSEHEYERRFATDSRAHWSVCVYRPTVINVGRYAYRRRLRPVLKEAYLRGREVGIPDLRALRAGYQARRGRGNW